MATSLNFIVPVGGFFDEFGAVHVSWATQLRVLGDVGVVVSRNASLGVPLLGVWIVGTAWMLTRLLVRIRADRRAARAVVTAPGAVAVEPALRAHGARRRDNLIRLIHEIGLCVLWFHPLLWFTGWRLALYRELSCDESVLRHGRGEDLMSAMAKLAEPVDAPLLRASAASFMS